MFFHRASPGGGVLKVGCYAGVLMASRVFGVRASELEREAWRLAASRSGLSLNAWVRRALTQAAELEAALARQEEGDVGDRVVPPAASRGD